MTNADFLELLNDPGMTNGDVFLLTDGRMLRLIDMLARPDKALSEVQFIDRDVETFINFSSLEVEKNLGQSNSVLASFYSNRSLHLRFNRFPEEKGCA